MQNKSKGVLRRVVFLSLVVGLWNAAFVIGQSSQNFFGTALNMNWFSGIVPFSSLALLLIALQLTGVLKAENPVHTGGKTRKESLGSRIVSYVIILAFGGFVLWFLWMKVFSTLLK